MPDRCYEAERARLQELCGEFAAGHPAQAPLLEGAPDDPDVRLLLSGVAHLNAVIRRRLDDSFPELTHTLMEQFYPHHLRPLPAATTLAIQPINLTRPLPVPRGTVIRSRPVEGVACPFQTCFDVHLLPIRIAAARFERDGGESGLLTIGIEPIEGADLAQLPMASLRLFLGVDAAAAQQLLLVLRRRVHHLEVRWRHKEAPLDSAVAAATTLGPQVIREVGFDDESAGLWPYPANSLASYRLLQEYLTFAAGFHYLDVDLAAVRPPASAANGMSLELRIVLRDLPQGFTFSPSQLRLFCTPAVNLFRRDAEPIRLDHRQTEYLLRPNGPRSAHDEIYAIERISLAAPMEAEVPPLLGRDRRRSDLGILYEARRRPARGAPAGTDMYLRFAFAETHRSRSSGDAPPGAPEVSQAPSSLDAVLQPYTVSVALLCTNGVLPSRLQPGDICVPAQGFPTNQARCADIGGLAPAVSPIQEDETHWRLLSHLSLGFATCASAESLRRVLILHDLRGASDAAAAARLQTLCDAIHRVQCEVKDSVYRGAPVRVAHTTVTLDPGGIASEGAAFLFGLVLERILADRVSANVLSRLTLDLGRRHRPLAFPARAGKDILL